MAPATASANSHIADEGSCGVRGSTPGSTLTDVAAVAFPPRPSSTVTDMWKLPSRRLEKFQEGPVVSAAGTPSTDHR